MKRGRALALAGGGEYFIGDDGAGTRRWAAALINHYMIIKCVSIGIACVIQVILPLPKAPTGSAT